MLFVRVCVYVCPVLVADAELHTVQKSELLAFFRQYFRHDAAMRRKLRWVCVANDGEVCVMVVTCVCVMVVTCVCVMVTCVCVMVVTCVCDGEVCVCDGGDVCVCVMVRCVWTAYAYVCVLWVTATCACGW